MKQVLFRLPLELEGGAEIERFINVEKTFLSGQAEYSTKCNYYYVTTKNNELPIIQCKDPITHDWNENWIFKQYQEFFGVDDVYSGSTYDTYYKDKLKRYTINDLIKKKHRTYGDYNGVSRLT